MGGKIAGVLIEVLPAKYGTVVLCGIGCNLERAPEEVDRSVSVNELGGSVSRYDLIREMTPVLLDHTDRFIREGFGGFREDWLACAYRPSGPVAIRSGEGVLSGQWGGVTSLGELVVLDEGGKERVISSGEIIA